MVVTPADQCMSQRVSVRQEVEEACAWIDHWIARHKAMFGEVTEWDTWLHYHCPGLAYKVGNGDKAPEPPPGYSLTDAVKARKVPFVLDRFPPGSMAFYVTGDYLVDPPPRPAPVSKAAVVRVGPTDHTCMIYHQLHEIPSTTFSNCKP